MNKFLTYNWKLRVTIIGILTILFIYLILNWWLLPYSSILKYLMIPFLMPIFSFAASPLFAQIGTSKYLSKLLFITEVKDDYINLHFSSLFDCVISGYLKERGVLFQRKLLEDLLLGLLTLIEKIELEEIDKDKIIMGSSYFFDFKTANRFGFQQTDLDQAEKVLLILNYLEIYLVHALGKGMWKLPTIKNFKTVKIKAEDLSLKKDIIQKLYLKLQKKNTVNSSHRL